MNDEPDDLIDQRLRAAFAPPPAEHYEQVARGASRPTRTLWPWALAAAAAMLAFVLLVDSSRRGVAVGPDGHSPKQLGAMWVAAYDHSIDQGFGVGGCCENSADLASRCQEVCGQSLSYRGDEDQDVQLLGCYCGSLPTGGCVGVLLQVRGDPVAVFVLPLSRDPRPILVDRDDLVLSRRELGGLALYSVAYEDRQEALAGFSL